jgi:hypothetical protein
MEQPNFENSEQKSLEEIKGELRAQWDKLFNNLIQNKFSAETKEKIKATEFNRIMEVYKNQERPLESYDNLNKALANGQNDVKKLTLFYQDAYYEKEGTVEKNREGNLAVAQDFINFLSPGQQREFRNIFK